MNTSDFPPEINRYPYFMQPVIDMLHSRDIAPELRSRLKSRLAVNIGSPTALRDILGLDSESLSDFYDEATTRSLSTLDTIDSFISRFGSSAATPAPLITEPDDIAVPFSPDATGDESLAALAASINSGEEPEEIREEPEEAEAGTTGSSSHTLTEGFARILIKNGNFTKALEIITELNLKNPKKSIYFADQIRFLKKLIANQSKL